MKIVTDEGIKKLEKLIDGKLISTDKLNKNLKFWFETPDKQKNAHYEFKKAGLKYSVDQNISTIVHEELPRILSKEDFTEERIWLGAGGKIFLCREMEHGHLSNCIGYLEILIVLGKIDDEKSENYIAALQESVVPELEERFGGVALDYVPHYDWEIKQFEEYLRVKK